MPDAAMEHAEDQAPLEGVIKDEVLRMYQEVAEHPDAEFHFYHGRAAAEMFGYERTWLDRAPAGAVASFAGVGNPHLRSRLALGETVLGSPTIGLDGTIYMTTTQDERRGALVAVSPDGSIRWSAEDSNRM